MKVSEESGDLEEPLLEGIESDQTNYRLMNKELTFAI